MTGEGSTPDSVVLFKYLIEYHPLSAQRLHSISNKFCSTEVLYTNVLEDFRIDTGGDADMGLSASKVVGVLSAPFLFLDGGECTCR